MSIQVVSALTLGGVSGAEAPGLSLRTPTLGQEYELLRQYVHSQLPSTSEDELVTVFLEPRVEVGFPDAVVVFWDPLVSKDWPNCRGLLTKLDLRLLHYIIVTGSVPNSELEALFTTAARKSIERLVLADMVLYSSEGWRSRSLSELFAVKRLIAIEAKLSSLKVGVRQAHRNTWFASESYLLIHRSSTTDALAQYAAHQGVGILATDDPFESAIPPERRGLPTSYASWQFNEWSWLMGRHSGRV